MGPFKINVPNGGTIEVEPPENATPGMMLKYRLAPPHEFRLRVPPGLKPGESARFQRPDGVEISVPVPRNLKPGDSFEVLPPALMVLVPENVKPGEYVIFCNSSQVSDTNSAVVRRWCRAQVPEGAESGKYFGARLPVVLPML